MRKFTFLVACLFVVFTLSAQKQATRSLIQKGPKIKNIATGEAATPSKAVTKIFNYDNNEIAGGLGTSSAHSIGAVIQIPASALTSYVEQTIDAVRYGIDNNSIITAAEVVIYEGNLDGTPVVSQDVAVGSLISGWNMITLAEGYKIPSATDIFVGIMVTTNAGGYTVCFDTDAASAPEYSGHLFFNGAYYGTLTADVGINADWNLQAILTDAHGIGEMSDLTITAIDKTTQSCGLSATEKLKVTLYNAGQNTINEEFNVTLKVNNTSLVQQVITSNFEPGTEMVVEVSSFDMSAFGVYDVVATFDYDDVFTNNNTFETLISTGDSKVTIDLTTDAFPSETQWYLVDINGDVVAINGTLEAETRTVTEVCVDAASCYTWVIYDSYGDGIMGYNSPAGTFTISYNGEAVATCPTGGDFGSQFNVFGLGNGCHENDIVLNSLDIPSQVAPGELEIKGKIFNNGSASLTSFDVTYTVGDYTSPVYSVSGIDLAIGETYDFVHDTKYNFITDGNYTIVVTVSNPNGVADENPDNNTLEDKITIVTGILLKKQLFEHFTSSTCGPCASYTPTADALLAGNQGNYSLIRYQVNWPGEGDPYFIQQAKDRVNYYGVTGVPSVYRNGTYDMDVTQQGFNTYAEQTTVINLDVASIYVGTNVVVSATIKPIADLPAGLTAHIVIVENTTYDNASTNGEDEFHNVMMQMLPTSAGTTLGAIAANGSFTITESYDMANSFVEEMSDLTAVVFIQDGATKEVLQSEMIAIHEGPAEILSFSFHEDAVPAVINSANATVTSKVVYGTNLANLTPSITVSPGAQVTITTTDFTNPVEVLVDAQNGTTKTWTVTVTAIPTVSVTFNVDMSSYHGFNPPAEKVYVEGSFGTEKVELSSTDNINYMGTVSVLPNTTYTYKYSTTNVTEVDNREVVVAGIDTEVNDDFKIVNIIFNVDMSSYHGFNPPAEKVYVEGSFGTGKVELSSTDNIHYTGTVSVLPNTTYTYKYSTTNVTEADNREVIVAGVDIAVNDDFRTVGVEDNKLSSVKLFPNPFRNTLTISNIEGITSITVSSTLGQAVMTLTEINTTSVELSTSELQNGVYFITITDNNNNSRIERIVKQ